MTRMTRPIGEPPVMLDYDQPQQETRAESVTRLASFARSVLMALGSTVGTLVTLSLVVAATNAATAVIFTFVTLGLGSLAVGNWTEAAKRSKGPPPSG
jgi:hypothetical protein